MSRPVSVLSSARLIALCTLASRLTGLLRDMLLAQTYGLVGVLDAFNYGFQIPNLFRRLFGEGALAAAFVPIFTRTLENQGRPAGRALLARALALMTVAITTVVVLLELILLFVWLSAGDDPSEEAASRRLLVSLTAIMLPFMLTICIVALFSSVLNCVGSFVPAALTPVILNVAMIAGILLLGPAVGDTPGEQIFGVALSVIAAGIVQILLLLPLLSRADLRVGWRLDTRDENVRKVLGLMVPVLIGQGVLILGPFLDSQVCWLFSRVSGGAAEATWFGLTFRYPLQEGALSALTNAQRLYQFPLGVLAISLAVAALPTFTRLANREDWAGWAAEIGRTLRLALLAGLLAGALMVVWSEPIVRMLFEYRRFGAEDTTRVAHILVWYGLGLWAFCTQHIVLRAFYSLGDIRTPLLISCVLLPVNLVLSLLLIWLPGVREAAFAISAALTSTISVLVGMLLLQRRTPAALWSGDLLSAAVRMIVAAGIGAFAVWASADWLHALSESLPAVWLQRSVETMAGLVLGSAVCLAVAAALGLPEPRLLLRRVSK